MKLRWILIVTILVAWAMAAMAQAHGPKIIGPDEVAFGRTYAEWTTAWQQWALAAPVYSHPLYDNGDCSVGQTGPVWFLGGKFCSLDNTNCGTSNVVRSCRVPEGKALFVDVLNVEVSALEIGDPNAQINDIRALAQMYMDGATDLRLEVDGANVPHLKDRFRMQSLAFGFSLPADNQFNAQYGTIFPAGDYFPAVDDGVYVMLAPLPHGHHTIHFHGYFPDFDFTLDVTYHIFVAK